MLAGLIGVTIVIALILRAGDHISGDVVLYLIAAGIAAIPLLVFLRFCEHVVTLLADIEENSRGVPVSDAP